MKKFVAVVFYAASLVMFICAVASANDLTLLDAKQTLALWKRTIDLQADISARRTGEPTKVIMCLLLIGEHLMPVQTDLYTSYFLLQSSGAMANSNDEKMVLFVGSPAFEKTVSDIDGALRGEEATLNECDKSPLTYDKAKAAIELLRATKISVAPIIQRATDSGNQLLRDITR
jgi:hypothetical protein